MSLAETTQNIQSQAANADALGSSLKFVFTDTEGVVLLDGTGEENVVSNEDVEAQCTIKVAKEDLDAMLSGELNPMNAFMGGKMQIEGDMGVAMKLSSFFN